MQTSSSIGSKDKRRRAFRGAIRRAEMLALILSGALFGLTATSRAQSNSLTVTVTASQPNASEAGPVPGVFTVTRNQSGTPLTVNFSLGGTATYGVDYFLLPSNSVTFAANATVTNVTVLPIDDGVPEPTETILLGLFGWPGSAIVNLLDSTPTNQSYTITIQPGLNLIANHLDAGDNRLQLVFSNNVPDGTELRKWHDVEQVFTVDHYDAGAATWKDTNGNPSTTTFSPGEAAFLNNPGGAYSLTFLGQPHIPVLPLKLAGGPLHFVSRQTMGTGTFENIIGVLPEEGAKILRWDGSGFATNTFTVGQWDSGAPFVITGEGVGWITLERPNDTCRLIVDFQLAPTSGTGPIQDCTYGNYDDSIYLLIGRDCKELYVLDYFGDDDYAAKQLAEAINYNSASAYRAIRVGDTAVMIVPKSGGLIADGTVLHVPSGCLQATMRQVHASSLGSVGGILNFDPVGNCGTGPHAPAEESCTGTYDFGLCPIPGNVCISLRLPGQAAQTLQLPVHSPYATDEQICLEVFNALKAAPYNLQVERVGKTTLWIQQPLAELTSCPASSGLNVGCQLFACGGCLVGVSTDGNLNDVDSQTGAASNARALQFDPANGLILTDTLGLAWSTEKKQLYTVTTAAEIYGSANSLYRVDRISGQASKVIDGLGIGDILDGDLSFGPDGLLYLAAKINTVTLLYTINLDSFVVTPKGQLSGSAITGLAWDTHDAKLYTLDNNGSSPVLRWVDPNNAGTQASWPVSGLLFAGSLEYEPATDTFYATACFNTPDNNCTSYLHKLPAADLRVAPGGTTVAFAPVGPTGLHPAFPGLAAIPCNCGGDLWMADTALDQGAEPDPDSSPMWVSDDIWVRNQDDGIQAGLLPPPQNPKYYPGGSHPNFVYVRVRNRGSQEMSGNLKLYVSKASTGLGWPHSWGADQPNGVYVDLNSGLPIGRQIGTPIWVTVPADSEQIFKFPWQVPNPSDYTLIGAEAGHWCLLARIETEDTTPYGMTYPEVVNDLYGNVQRNNNIVWRNVHIADEDGYGKRGSVLIANPATNATMPISLRFALRPGAAASVFTDGQLLFDLGPLRNRWVAAGSQGSGIQATGSVFRVLNDGAQFNGIVLDPGELASVNLEFTPNPGALVSQGKNYDLDLVQYRTDQSPPVLVGGQRFTFMVQSTLLAGGSNSWRYLDDGSDQGTAWQAPGFNDSQWASGPPPLGFGQGGEATTVSNGPPENPFITYYFRNKFVVTDPASATNVLMHVRRDDGIVAYLNGVEIWRDNMPGGPVNSGTFALGAAPDNGQEWQSIPLDSSLLLAGTNVLAVEVHQDTTRDDLKFDLRLSAEVLPVTPPCVEIACPANIAVPCQGAPGTVVNFAAQAWSNCGTNITLVCTPASGSVFPPGVTPVSCVAYDDQGNTAQCGFTVTVSPAGTSSVVLACPASVEVCSSNGCGPMPNAAALVMATNNTGSVFVSQSIPPGTLVCSNTVVTFTYFNGCGAVTLCTAPVVVGPCCTVQGQGWTSDAPMPAARWGAAAELLPSGRVLVAGGGVISAQFLTAAEIFDPALNAWVSGVPALPQPHRLTAVRLLNGQVLVAGDDFPPTYTAYLYDEIHSPSAWLSAGNPNSQHIQGTLTRLASGNVLLAGGYCGGGCATYNTAEIYSPQPINGWTTTGSLTTTRLGHTATLLPSGKVLVAGGAQRIPILIQSECELFDEGAAAWSPASSMNQLRIYHTATLLPNGKVLVVGGMTGPNDFGHFTATAEIYDPILNTWTPCASMSTPRALHTATLLSSGKLLIAGGENDAGSLSSCEVYDYLTDSWTATTPLSTARYRHTATLLPSGEVFVTGGETTTALGDGLASSEIYGGSVTNKIVTCGSAWSFDVPQLTCSCSDSNPIPTVLSTITNGPCPQVITRTWLLTNSCGLSNTISQTVTVAVPGPLTAPVITSRRRDAAGMHIIIQTQPCSTYALECKNHLTDSSWNTCQTATGNGANWEFVDPAPLPTTRFYRVRRLCP